MVHELARIGVERADAVELAVGVVQCDVERRRADESREVGQLSARGAMKCCRGIFPWGEVRVWSRSRQRLDLRFQAGGDAEALARALREHDDIDTALKAYNAERQPYGNNVVMHGRKLGTHLGVNLKTEDDRRMHDLLQSDAGALDWIAVPNFLDAYK